MSPFRLRVGAAEVARAWVGAGLAVASTNALAIALCVRWPEAGLGLRLLHHAFDFVTVVGLAALWGLGAAACARWGKGPRWVGWLAYWVLCGVAMWGLLDQTLHRRGIVVATALGWEVPGPGVAVLYWALLALSALSILLAHWVGADLGRRRYGVLLPLSLGVGVVVASHAVLLDEYEDVHTAMLWLGGCLVGAAAAPRWRRSWVSQKAIRWLVYTGVAFALVAFCVPPPNRVRRELFREPGAVASFVLSQTLWTLPEVPETSRMEALSRLQKASRTPRIKSRLMTHDAVVVLLTVDALRADVVADRGNDRLLPTLAQLRDEGAYFEHATTPGSQSSVCHTSLFAGRYFSQLVWRRYGQGKRRRLYPATDPTPRLAELLNREGVRTLSFLTPGFLAGEYGIARGFQEQTVVAVGHASADDVMTPLLEKLERHGIGPAFFYAHLVEPHQPYDRGVLKDGSPYERYVSEVAVVDGWLGRLWRALRERFDGRGYLIVAGDHGEAFGEHGTTFHSKTLYEELLRVPLIIWGPGIGARRYSEHVGFIDIGPTILALLGQPVPEHAMGQSLLPILNAREYRRRYLLAAEGRLKRALYASSGLKVIEDARHKTVEVYDLRRDPEERVNLFETEPERAMVALAELRAFFDAYRLKQAGYRPPYKR